MKYDILEIKKCEEKINKSIYTTINDIKLIALCGVVLFSCEKGLFDLETTNILSVGSISGGTIGVISLVKSICNIYLTNEKKKELENDRCK